jgi:hypothetical protein
MLVVGSAKQDKKTIACDFVGGPQPSAPGMGIGHEHQSASGTRALHVRRGGQGQGRGEGSLCAGLLGPGDVRAGVTGLDSVP